MQREITRELVRRLLPGRMAESNKGSYGSVLAAAGSMAYRGAAALCTEGALRGGAGLVYLASVEPVIQLVLSRTPECCACGCRTAAGGGIHPQDAVFLEREVWDLDNTPLDKRPLLLHFHPLVIYRYQVLKQADVVLALYLQGNHFTDEEKLADFEYYDPLTTGDSTLSAVVQAILHQLLWRRVYVN